MKNHYETLMQRIIALGIAANSIAKACPERFKTCRDTAKECDEFLNRFRELPKWKKKVLNWVLS